MAEPFARDLREHDGRTAVIVNRSESSTTPRFLFVTGRLAEFALRQVLDELAPRAGFVPEIAVLPISVAALMTPAWVARRLEIPAGVDRIILPGHCRGDLTPILEKACGASVELGPDDLRDLPRHFGHATLQTQGYGAYDIEILAEINHVPRLPRDVLIGQADQFVRDGADVIDLGCDPGIPWNGIGDAVKLLRERGFRVSIDSFDPAEVSLAVAAGAELVLSVNATNREHAVDWGVEVVAIPDQPGSLEGLDQTVTFLGSRGIPFRIDPILEPIGFGFATSLGRYLEVRKPLSRDGDHDGHWKPERADRRRFRRREHASCRHLPGAGGSQRAHNRGDQLGQVIGP